MLPAASLVNGKFVFRVTSRYGPASVAMNAAQRGAFNEAPPLRPAGEAAGRRTLRGGDGAAERDEGPERARDPESEGAPEAGHGRSAGGAEAGKQPGPLSGCCRTGRQVRRRRLAIYVEIAWGTRLMVMCFCLCVLWFCRCVRTTVTESNEVFSGNKKRRTWAAVWGP